MTNEVELVHHRTRMIAEIGLPLRIERPASQDGIRRLVPPGGNHRGAVVAASVGTPQNDPIPAVRLFAVKCGIPAAIERHLAVETFDQQTVPVPVFPEETIEAGLFVKIIPQADEMPGAFPGISSAC